MFLDPLEGEVLVHCRAEVRTRYLRSLRTLKISLTEACIECAIRFDFGSGKEPEEAQPVLNDHSNDTIVRFLDNVLARECVRCASDVSVDPQPR